MKNKTLVNLLTRLKKKGFSDYDIADAAGCSQMLIWRTRTGTTEPKYSTALKLIELGKLTEPQMRRKISKARKAKRKVAAS